MSPGMKILLIVLLTVIVIKDPSLIIQLLDGLKSLVSSLSQKH